MNHDDYISIHDLSAELPEERERFERALQEFLDEHASPDAAAAAAHRLIGGSPNGHFAGANQPLSPKTTM